MAWVTWVQYQVESYQRLKKKKKKKNSCTRHLGVVPIEKEALGCPQLLQADLFSYIEEAISELRYISGPLYSKNMGQILFRRKYQ